MKQKRAHESHIQNVDNAEENLKLTTVRPAKDKHKAPTPDESFRPKSLMGLKPGLTKLHRFHFHAFLIGSNPFIDPIVLFL